MSGSARNGALLEAGVGYITTDKDSIGAASQIPPLSINLKEAGIVSIPTTTLQAIEEKAKQLLYEDSSIVPAPGSDNAYMVKSWRGEKPHYVVVKPEGAVMCDSSCPQWRGSRLCSHIIAVAEKENSLSQLLTKFTKSKREMNLSQLVITPKQKNAAGSKSVQPKRKRKEGERLSNVTDVLPPLWRQPIGQINGQPPQPTRESSAIESPLIAATQPSSGPLAATLVL